MRALRAASRRLALRWLPTSFLSKRPGARRRFAIVAVTIGVVVLVVAAVTTVGLLTDQPIAERPPRLPAADKPPREPDRRAAQQQAPEQVVVSVVGKVESPGLVTVPAGARVADAVRAAGGAVRDVDPVAMNLARRVVDGEQLYVGISAPQADAPVSDPAEPGSGHGGQPPSKINLNSAGLNELNEISGVGEVTAKHILNWRNQHGGFGSVEQLRDVEGIGETRFAKMRDQVTVG